MTAPILAIVSRHAEDAADLWNTRSVLVESANAKLLHVGRFDERIAAHLDGIAVAGDAGQDCCDSMLANADAGAVFATTVCALERGDDRAINALLAIAETATDTRAGLLSAFGWVSKQQLKDVVRSLLHSRDHFRRAVGIASCAMHRVDPGRVLGEYINDRHPTVRARAVRAAGDLGRRDLLPQCLALINDPDVHCQFWATWSSVILGDRREGLARLMKLGRESVRFSRGPLQLALMAIGLEDGQSLLGGIERESGVDRNLIRCVAAAGNPEYLPWLIELMSEPPHARIVGEAFSFITGADLARLDLDRKPPQTFEAGPTDDPDDPDVARDEDFGLPWPDTDKVYRWLQDNAHRFRTGQRYFIGAPPTGEQCATVLREGYQRQRAAAADWLALLGATNAVFNCAAPAWRQRRWLGVSDRWHG